MVLWFTAPKKKKKKIDYSNDVFITKLLDYNESLNITQQTTYFGVEQSEFIGIVIATIIFIIIFAYSLNTVLGDPNVITMFNMSFGG